MRRPARGRVAPATRRTRGPVQPFDRWSGAAAPGCGPAAGGRSRSSPVARQGECVRPGPHGPGRRFPIDTRPARQHLDERRQQGLQMLLRLGREHRLGDALAQRGHHQRDRIRRLGALPVELLLEPGRPRRSATARAGRPTSTTSFRHCAPPDCPALWSPWRRGEWTNGDCGVSRVQEPADSSSTPQTCMASTVATPLIATCRVRSDGRRCVVTPRVADAPRNNPLASLVLGARTRAAGSTALRLGCQVAGPNASIMGDAPCPWTARVARAGTAVARCDRRRSRAHESSSSASVGGLPRRHDAGRAIAAARADRRGARQSGSSTSVASRSFAECSMTASGRPC